MGGGEMEASNVFVRESKRLEYVIKGRGRGGASGQL